ncbi:hypothetical protein ACSBR2_020102 [Camellia fascicularis]
MSSLLRNSTLVIVLLKKQFFTLNQQMKNGCQIHGKLNVAILRLNNFPPTLTSTVIFTNRYSLRLLSWKSSILCMIPPRLPVRFNSVKLPSAILCPLLHGAFIRILLVNLTFATEKLVLRNFLVYYIGVLRLRKIH